MWTQRKKTSNIDRFNFDWEALTDDLFAESVRWETLMSTVLRGFEFDTLL